MSGNDAKEAKLSESTQEAQDTAVTEAFGRVFSDELVLSAEDLTPNVDVPLTTDHLDMWKDFATAGVVEAPHVVTSKEATFMFTDNPREVWEFAARVKVTKIDSSVTSAAQAPIKVKEIDPKPSSEPGRNAAFYLESSSQAQHPCLLSLPPDTGAVMTEAHPGVVWPSMLSPYYIGAERPWLPKGTIYSEQDRSSDEDDEEALACCTFRALNSSLAWLTRLYSSQRFRIIQSHNEVRNASGPVTVTYSYEKSNSEAKSTFPYPYGQRTLRVGYEGFVDRFVPMSLREADDERKFRLARALLMRSQATNPSLLWSLICLPGLCFPRRLRPAAHFTPPELATLDPLDALTLTSWAKDRLPRGSCLTTMRMFNSRSLTSLTRLLRPRGHKSASSSDIEQEMTDMLEGRERKGMGQGSSILYKFKSMSLCCNSTKPEYLPYLPAIMGGYFPLNAAAVPDQTEVMPMASGSIADMRKHTEAHQALFPDVDLRTHYDAHRYLNTKVPLPGTVEQQYLANPRDARSSKLASSSANMPVFSPQASSTEVGNAASPYTESLRTAYNNYYFGLAGSNANIETIVNADDRTRFASELVGGPFAPHISGNCRCADCAIYPAHVIPAGFMKEHVTVTGPMDLVQNSSMLPPSVPLTQGGDGGRAMFHLPVGRKPKQTTENTNIAHAGYTALSTTPSSPNATVPSITLPSAKVVPQAGYILPPNPPNLPLASPVYPVPATVEDGDESDGSTSHGQGNGAIRLQKTSSRSVVTSPPYGSAAAPNSTVAANGNHTVIDMDPSLGATFSPGLGLDAGPRVQRQHAIRSKLQSLPTLVVEPKYANTVCLTPTWVFSWISWFFALIRLRISSCYSPETILFYGFSYDSSATEYASAYFETAMYTPAFLKLSKRDLERFVASNRLNVDEFLLYQSIVRWGRHRLYARGEDHADPLLVRKEIDDILAHVRFEIMRYPELNYIAHGPPIVTPEEMHAIFFFKAFPQELKTLPDEDLAADDGSLQGLTLSTYRENMIQRLQPRVLTEELLNRPVPEVTFAGATEYSAARFKPDADQALVMKDGLMDGSPVGGGARSPARVRGGHFLNELYPHPFFSNWLRSSDTQVRSALTVLGVMDGNTTPRLTRSPILQNLSTRGTEHYRSPQSVLRTRSNDLSNDQQRRTCACLMFVHLTAFSTSFIPLFLIIGLLTFIGYGHGGRDFHSPAVYWSFAFITISVFATLAVYMFRLCCESCYSPYSHDADGAHQCLSMDFHDDSIACRGFSINEEYQVMIAFLMTLLGVEALLVWMHFSDYAKIPTYAFFIPFYIFYAALLIVTFLVANNDGELCLGLIFLAAELQFVISTILLHLKVTGVRNYSILIVFAPFIPTLLALAILVLVTLVHTRDEAGDWIIALIPFGTFGLLLTFIALYVNGVDYPDTPFWKPSLAVAFVPAYPLLFAISLFGCYVITRQCEDTVVEPSSSSAFSTLNSYINRGRTTDITA